MYIVFLCTYFFNFFCTDYHNRIHSTFISTNAPKCFLRISNSETWSQIIYLTQFVINTGFAETALVLKLM